MLTSEAKLMIGKQSSIIILILESKSFSNSFDRMGSKLIDLYDSASSAGLSGFWIIIICATFYWGGKKPHLSTALHS